MLSLRLLLPLVAALTVLFAVLPLRAESELLITSAVFPPFTTEARDGFEDRLIPEIYRRAGYSVRIERLPTYRALIMVEEGQADGVTSHVMGITRNFRNLVQMSEPLFRRDFVAFTRDPDLKIRDWNSLEPYSVAIMNGWKILEWNIKRYQSLHKAKNAEQLFRLLDSGRVDVVVYARYSGLYLLDKLGIEGVRIADRPLATRDMALILNKRHADKLPKLDAALREIKRDGTWQEVYDETIGPLLKPARH